MFKKSVQRYRRAIGACTVCGGKDPGCNYCHGKKLPSSHSDRKAISTDFRCDQPSENESPVSDSGSKE